MATDNTILTGLDIGSATVTSVIAEVGDNDTVKILGVGRASSNGLRRGVIVHLDRTSEAIARAISEAETMAGVAAEAVHVNINGDHIRGVNSRGVVAVAHRGGAIGEEDVDRVLGAARAVPVPPDREVLHVIPQEFLVDGQGGIKEPVGMLGARLEVNVHIITASALAVGNVGHCLREAGFELASLTLAPLATAEAALTERDREMGVALVDIGASLTSMVVVVDDAVRHTGAIAVGGRNITNDLAIGLRTPIDAAEDIKTLAGVATEDHATRTDPIEVPSVGDQPPRTVSQNVLAAIIGPRLEEILQLAKAEIRRAPGGDLLTSGIVLAGGGSSLPGAASLAERIFDLPVRVALPRNILGLTGLVASPANLAALGLVLRARESGEVPRRAGGVVNRVASRIANILSQLV